MRKTFKKAFAAVCAAAVFCFSGCEVVDAYIEYEVEKLVLEHFQKNGEILSMWEIEDCTDFKISDEKDGERKGTINLCLKHRTSGRKEKVLYDFKLKTESGYVLVNVHDPSRIIQLSIGGGLESLESLLE